MKRKRFTEEPMIGVLKEADARRAIESWRVHCNAVRPRRPLGFLAPEEFRAAGETGCGTPPRPRRRRSFTKALNPWLDLRPGEAHGC